MLRVRNLAKHAIDEIAPGAEGAVPHNRATRALVDAGLLELLEEFGPMRGKSSATQAPSERDMQSAIDEIERRGVRIEQLAARVEGLVEEVDHLRASNIVKCGACDQSHGPVPCEHCNGAALVPAVAEVDRLRAQLVAASKKPRAGAGS